MHTCAREAQDARATWEGGDKAMPAFGLPLLSVAIFIAVNNANGNRYVLAFANALHAMQKLKQCGSRVHTRTHGVAQARFGCVARTCVYIYNPQGLYNSPFFLPHCIRRSFSAVYNYTPLGYSCTKRQFDGQPLCSGVKNCELDKPNRL